MNTRNWLTLMEYSAKYRVSLSTLRRRIKAGEIEFKFVDGKYVLKDGPLLTTTQGTPETIAPPTSVSSQGPTSEVVEEPEEASDQFWKTTQGLLSEIKKAYSLVLQEKEELILHLKEEVADLKTLVRVLEEQNNKLNQAQPSLDLDLGLEV